jgi:hypothetical protein
MRAFQSHVKKSLFFQVQDALLENGHFKNVQKPVPNFKPRKIYKYILVSPMTYRRRKVTDLYIYLVKDPKTGLYREATVEEIKFNKKKTMKNKEPAQAKPDQAKPDQAEEIQAEPDQAQQAQAKPIQAKPIQAKPDQAKPIQAKQAQTKKEEGPKQIKVKIQVPAKAKAQIKAKADLQKPTSGNLPVDPKTSSPINEVTPLDESSDVTSSESVESEPVESDKSDLSSENPLNTDVLQKTLNETLAKNELPSAQKVEKIKIEANELINNLANQKELEQEKKIIIENLSILKC